MEQKKKDYKGIFLQINVYIQLNSVKYKVLMLQASSKVHLDLMKSNTTLLSLFILYSVLSVVGSTYLAPDWQLHINWIAKWIQVINMT